MGTVATLLDLSTGEVRREFTGHKGTVRCVAFTPDGKQLISGGNDHKVNLWNLSSGEVERTLSDFKGNVVGVAISSDGKWLATTCNRDDDVKLWNLEQPEQPVHQYPTKQHDASQITFSPDSRLLVIPNIALIDVASGEAILSFSHYWDVECAVISPNGQWMALATQWLPLDLLPFHKPAGPEEEAQIAAIFEHFTDDDYAKREAASQSLAALDIAALPQLCANLESPSAEVRIRCRRLIERLANADYGVKLFGHAMQPHWVAFSPDSKTLASGDWEGVVKLWNVAEAKEIATLDPN